MAVHKLALIRYKTIDDCLRNRYRKWTLDALVEKVSEVLFEQEGIPNGVSRRTIQGDIQLMRSDKLGYNAPIIVRDKKYYVYEDPGYSITKVPINNQDVDKMKEIVGVLKQLNGFSYFEEMSDMIARLENNLYKSTRQSGNCIQFENNRLLKGLQLISPVYQAILNQTPVLIEYQSFRALKPQHLIVSPYLLKEYRNRWFLICMPRKGENLNTLALDRIIELQELPNESFKSYQGIDFDRYFSDLVGVTKSEKDRPYKVILHVDRQQAPYVRTKPIHHSQQVLKEEDDGSILLRIDVVLNFELERELLGFGEHVKVLAPRHLVQRIKKRAARMLEQYAPPAKPTRKIAGNTELSQ